MYGSFFKGFEYSLNGFRFNINEEYDFGMVIKKSEFSHKNEGYYVAVLLNSSNIVYRHADEVYKI